MDLYFKFSTYTIDHLDTFICLLLECLFNMIHFCVITFFNLHALAISPFKTPQNICFDY